MPVQCCLLQFGLTNSAVLQDASDLLSTYRQPLFTDVEEGSASLALVPLETAQSPANNNTSKHQEIEIFHDQLELFVEQYGLVQAPSLVEYSDLATEFSTQLNRQRVHAKDSQQLVPVHQRSRVAEQEKRTERDFWSLLHVLSISDVMGVVDDQQCQRALEAALETLPPVVTIPDYLNTAFSEDLRFKKAKVVKDWLENAYGDQVVDTPVPRSPPMFETWLSIQQYAQPHGAKVKITRGQAQLAHVHPDSQLHAAGLLTLVGSDQAEQDALLLSIWQLIRSGQIDVAQRKAFEHQAFWLASSLRGCDPHWYIVREGAADDVERMDDDGLGGPVLTRRGNARHGLSMKTAFQYADHLLQSQQKTAAGVSIASNATMAEMSIYAALSNHVEALHSSELVSTWADRLWVYANSVYHRDLVRIYEQYYERKRRHSALYPGCDDKNVETNRWLSAEFARSVQGNLDESVAAAVPPPPTKNLECILRQLQIAFLGGVRAIKRFFDAQLLELIEPADPYPGYEHVLRVVVHVLLWCGLRPATLHAPLEQVVSQELYYHALETYIAHLIEQAHYKRVALYARFLSPHRRVVAFARLLLAIQSDHVQARSTGAAATLSRAERDALSREVLEQAQRFFPDDLPDVTRTVMEDGSRPTSLLATLRPAAPTTAAAAGGSTEPAGAAGGDAMALVPHPTAKPSFLSPLRPSRGGDFAAPSTTAPPAAPSTGPSEADRLVLESLRWVVLESLGTGEEQQQDAAKVAEVLRAVHRVIGALLVESQMDKASLLSLVLTEYATEEIIVRADQRMEHLSGRAAPATATATEASWAPLYEEQWALDKDVYSLWHVLQLVYQQREKWRDVVEAIRLAQRRSVGAALVDGRWIVPSPPMALFHELRAVVLDELLPRIEAIFAADADGAHGVVTVLQRVAEVAVTASQRLLEDALAVAQGRAAVPVVPSARDDPHLSTQLTQQLRELRTQLETLASTDARRPRIEQLATQLEAQLAPNAAAVPSEGLLRMYKLLQVATLRLKDAAETQKLLSLLVHYLLQAYLSCCLRSSEALVAFAGLADDGVRATHDQVLLLAFRLSDMIANEAPSLGLHRLLTT